mmetsp:Transcript_53167/g.140533  ORF Transcript_53167/g.140533 Transcript_53167/m.140533 type:complete len:90 (+) Transcript_53167:1432-1701(+)
MDDDLSVQTILQDDNSTQRTWAARAHRAICIGTSLVFAKLKNARWATGNPSSTMISSGLTYIQSGSMMTTTSSVGFEFSSQCMIAAGLL